MSPSTNPLTYSPCKVPLRTVRGAFNINLTVHEGIVADTWEADRRWRALGGPKFFLVRQGDTGSYNCRNSVGHSRAVVIDFNWASQGMHKRNAPGSAACRQLPGMKEFYEKCWKPLGYGWGALWRSKCDAMHVSKLISEGGDGVLYRTWPSSPVPQPAPQPQPKPIKEDDVAYVLLTPDHNTPETGVTIPIFQPGEVLLACDHGDAKVRVAIGRAEKWDFVKEVTVPHGDRVDIPVPRGSGAQMVNLVHRGGPSVGVIVR